MFFQKLCRSTALYEYINDKKKTFERSDIGVPPAKQGDSSELIMCGPSLRLTEGHETIEKAKGAKRPVAESMATLPPFGPIEGQKSFDQISSQ